MPREATEAGLEPFEIRPGPNGQFGRDDPEIVGFFRAAMPRPTVPKKQLPKSGGPKERVGTRIVPRSSEEEANTHEVS